MAQAGLKQQRRRLRVQGLVQGVGFRPFACRLAERLALTGAVGNDAGGVWLEVQGPAESLEDFQRCLRSEAPPASRVQDIQWELLDLREESSFRILSSRPGPASTLLSPDLALCRDCLNEMLDPNNRRWGYPFINCTQCGPRLTIVRQLPYDRSSTTMHAFTQCPACQGEYTDARDRRFHAQPNACPSCGPQLSWHDAGPRLHGEPALRLAVRRLGEGAVIAVKGIGGYHLSCDALRPQSVARLRQLKRRPDKPLALMVRDLETLREMAEVDPEEASWLQSEAAPIVLLQAREGGLLGAMLPYSGLHHLLLRLGPPVLVMTSANFSGEPIEYQEPERVSGLCDGVLSHDRPIQVACDDSVGFVFRKSRAVVRRGRGLAPLPLGTPFHLPPVLALGGDLKSAFCLANADRAFLSQHLGDLQSLESLRGLEYTLDHYRRIFSIQPEQLVVDCHPGYLGKQWAEKLQLPTMEVQHHHAHLASLMGEHGLSQDESLLGFAFDGTGYGQDGQLWGGELLEASYAGFRRVAHLSQIPLIGGDEAVRRPYRLALAALWHYGLEPAGLIAIEAREEENLQRLWRGGHWTASTSMGRLFDVVASLCGLCRLVSYEGQAALALESILDPQETGAYDWDTNWHVGDLLAQVVEDLRAGVKPPRVSARFHQSLADTMARSAAKLSAHRVGLSGGVFQNRALLRRAVEALEKTGIQVLWHEKVPCTDGGLAYGQALVAGASRRDPCA
ncbi:MAG: carbamoyltransferase HypF [Vulcanimicrobiota bacterium]